jgi:small-conductance mechanosensitive channel
MAQMARNFEERQEFWKPPVQVHQEVISDGTGQVCDRCGTDFIMGSRFCHVCGADRNSLMSQSSRSGLREWFDYASVRDALGQTNISLITLFVGLACVIAAAVTGFLYTATTLLDWQAVQIWRIEWLLAATAVFALGVLLKKKA